MLIRDRALKAGAGLLLCSVLAAARAQDERSRTEDDRGRAEQMKTRIREVLASQPAAEALASQPTAPDDARIRLATSQPAPADDAAVRSEYEALLKTQAPALVRIKYVQQTQGARGDYEGENEIVGVMIEPTGLVMCSNTRFGGSRGRFRSGRSIPTKIKVLVGDDTEGLEARFVARDTELDLAWVQIKEPGDRRFACIDLSAAEEPVLGQRVLTLGLMGKYFGEAVLVSEGRLAGHTHKPRDLYIFRGSLDTDAGLPVFTAAGRLVGFATLQRPEADEVSGDMSGMTTRGYGLILPAATMAKATARAKEVQATEESEEEEPTTKP
jgi:S1-C subfamily serine protease